MLPRSETSQLLSASDYVVICLPGTPETHQVIDAAALARMKPSAVLVNIGRGTHVDEPALVGGALSASGPGRLGGTPLRGPDMQGGLEMHCTVLTLSDGGSRQRAQTATGLSAAP